MEQPGAGSKPIVIAEIGINHDGDFKKAVRMIEDAFLAGCKWVKFQCHCDDEYIPLAKSVIPPNAKENIYDMMARCSFTEEQERCLKTLTESMGMTYLSTPFSRDAVDRLDRLGVSMFKIGSGECNNYPLIRLVASMGKPIILSTGMNTWYEIDKAVDIIGDQLYAILHCVSEYPTPYEHVNLKRMLEIKERYGVKTGLSDHSKGIYTALGAVALGAEVIEKHFTSDSSWSGADVPISITPNELRDIIRGADAIYKSLQTELPDDFGVKSFAFASVVSTQRIRAGMTFTRENIWVKRPGGGILPEFYENILGLTATIDIPKDAQIKQSDFNRLATK